MYNAHPKLSAKNIRKKCALYTEKYGKCGVIFSKTFNVFKNVECFYEKCSSPSLSVSMQLVLLVPAVTQCDG